MNRISLILLTAFFVVNLDAAEPEIVYQLNGNDRIANLDTPMDRVITAVVNLIRKSQSIPRLAAHSSSSPARINSDIVGLRNQLQLEVGEFRDGSLKASEVAVSFVNGDGEFRAAEQLSLKRDENLNQVLRLENNLDKALSSHLRSLSNETYKFGSFESNLQQYLKRLERLPVRLDDWWTSLVHLRATLAVDAAEFDEAAYPELQYISLDWQGGKTELELDAMVPAVIKNKIAVRIEQAKISVNRLTRYVDLQIHAHETLNAYRFVSARYRYGLPGCEGNHNCIAALKQDLRHAEGRLAEADAFVRGARVASVVATGRTADVSAFEKELTEQNLQLVGNINRLGEELNRLDRDIETSIENAFDVCRLIETHYKLQIEECHPYTEASVVADGLALSGNASMPGFDVREHVFLMFNYRLPLPSDYGAYTYVVFPAQSSPDHPQRGERYKSLLAAIVARTPGAAYATRPRAELNLFSIPSRIDCDAPNDPESCLVRRSDRALAADISQYHVDLGLALSSILNNGDLLTREVQTKIAGKRGPILITTETPYHQMADTRPSAGYQPLMLVDLSDYDPGSFERIVEAYKSAIVSSTPPKSVIWEPPKKEWIYANVIKIGALSEAVINSITAQISSLGG